MKQPTPMDPLARVVAQTTLSAEAREKDWQAAILGGNQANIQRARESYNAALEAKLDAMERQLVGLLRGEIKP